MRHDPGMSSQPLSLLWVGPGAPPRGLPADTTVAAVATLDGAGLHRHHAVLVQAPDAAALDAWARDATLAQAAFEAALRYANERKVFSKPIFDYSMTQWKITRMAAIIQACRQATFHACDLMDQHKGSMEASLVKFYTSKVSEWVTREALHIHGGYGYAEEYAVSRYFVDARVFSIFEGAEEVLALRVIAPALLKQYL